jgi:uncharacterized protein YggU (UPF0235/DUF167 family)
MKMKILVKVKPGSRQERVEKIGESSFSIWVKEKPVEGRATEAVMRVLAEYFDVAKSGVILIKGQASRNKIFEIRK